MEKASPNERRTARKKIENESSTSINTQHNERYIVPAETTGCLIWHDLCKTVSQIAER